MILSFSPLHPRAQQNKTLGCGGNRACLRGNILWRLEFDLCVNHRANFKYYKKEQNRKPQGGILCPLPLRTINQSQAISEIKLENVCLSSGWEIKLVTGDKGRFIFNANLINLPGHYSDLPPFKELLPGRTQSTGFPYIPWKKRFLSNLEYSILSNSAYTGA